MKPTQFQIQSASDRKESVLLIKKSLNPLDKEKYPNISKTLQSGNTKIYALLNLILDQFYVLNFDIDSSLLGAAL